VNRQLIQSLLLAVVILILAILAWQLSNKDLALVLGSLLAARLIDQFLVFGKKDDESRLAYRANLLTQPLQTIFSNLSNQWELRVDQATDVFVHEIQNKALLKVLQKDSATLPRLLLELVDLERDVSKKEFQERSKTLFPNHPDIIQFVKADLRRKEPRMAELRERIRSEIEQVLAKYSGA